jgi:hypothetical protein
MFAARGECGSIHGLTVRTATDSGHQNLQGANQVSANPCGGTTLAAMRYPDRRTTSAGNVSVIASAAMDRDIRRNPVEDFFRVQLASVEYRDQYTGGK